MSMPQFESTGVPNLDQVLGGGLPRGALVIIAGAPGSGKTTLANQLAFTAAHAGRKALVLTALSEPGSKLIAHLRSFSFFDENLIGEQVQFLSLQQYLAGGLVATGNEIVAMARKMGASFVVLDGFRGVRGADVDPQAARQFLYDVGTTLSTLGATTIITSEANPRDPSFFPEATTADVIIGLHYQLYGVQHHRAIEAIKIRGAAPLSGLHGLSLNEDGAIIFPRIETRMEIERQRAVQDDHAIPILLSERVGFGLPEFDVLLNGGLNRGTTTLLAGSPGVGKTFLSLNFALAGVRAGESVLFMGFRESRDQLLQKAQPFAWDEEFREAMRPGGPLTLLRYSPVELNPDVLAHDLITMLDRTGADRLVVDSIAELERAASNDGGPHRVHNFMAALVEVLRQRGVTSLFIKEISQTAGTEINFSSEAIAVLAENLLLMRQVERQGRLHRILSVLKMRFSAHDATTLRIFTVVPPDGIRVLGEQASNEIMGAGEAS